MFILDDSNSDQFLPFMTFKFIQMTERSYFISFFSELAQNGCMNPNEYTVIFLLFGIDIQVFLLIWDFVRKEIIEIVEIKERNYSKTLHVLKSLKVNSSM